MPKDRLIATLAFLAPFTLVFNIFCGILNSIYPTEKLIESPFGFFELIILCIFFAVTALLFSIDPKIYGPLSKSNRSFLTVPGIGVIDCFILTIIGVLHLTLNFGGVSIRHLDGGISSVGVTAYIYYLLKPVVALIIIKTIRRQNVLSELNIFLVSVIFFLYPSSALDSYYIFAFLCFKSAKRLGQLNLIFLASLLGLVVSCVIYVGLSVKVNVSELQDGAVYNELIYRAGLYPVSFSFYLNNFWVVSIDEVFNIYGEVNQYRLAKVFGDDITKPSVESINRLNFLNTNLWDSSNAPGASPGLWGSLLISPISFLLCVPIFWLSIRYIYIVFFTTQIKNWYLMLGLSTPLFFPLLAGPLDFVFLLGGGWAFIAYLLGQEFLIRLCLGRYYLHKTD